MLGRLLRRWVGTFQQLELAKAEMVLERVARLRYDEMSDDMLEQRALLARDRARRGESVRTKN